MELAAQFAVGTSNQLPSPMLRNADNGGADHLNGGIMGVASGSMMRFSPTTTYESTGEACMQNFRIRDDQINCWTWLAIQLEW